MLFSFTVSRKTTNIEFIRDFNGEFEQTLSRLKLKLEKLFKSKIDKEMNIPLIILPEGIIFNKEVIFTTLLILSFLDNLFLI